MDSEGEPIFEVASDGKYWWVHNEVLLALIHALYLKGGKEYEQWYDRVHDYTFNLFPDPEYGEWIGYCHRDGRVSLRIIAIRYQSLKYSPMKARQFLNSFFIF